MISYLNDVLMEFSPSYSTAIHVELKIECHFLYVQKSLNGIFSCSYATVKKSSVEWAERRLKSNSIFFSKSRYQLACLKKKYCNVEKPGSQLRIMFPVSYLLSFTFCYVHALELCTGVSEGSIYVSTNLQRPSKLDFGWTQVYLHMKGS